MSLGQMDTPRLPPEITSLASRPSKFKRKHAGTQGGIKKQNKAKTGETPRELASTHNFKYLEEIKKALTSFERFHSLLMARLKTRSWSKLLALQKRVREPQRWLAKPLLLSSKRFEVIGFSLAALLLAWDALSLSGHLLVGSSLSTGPRVFGCFVTLAPLFYLHVAAPALCQS